MSVYENEKIKAIVENGLLKELYDKSDDTKTNLANANKACGSVGYTLMSEDITTQETDNYRMFEDRVGKDGENGFFVEYSADDDGLIIHAHCENSEISQFALNLDLNFLGTKGTSYRNQLLPTSSYSSKELEYNYCVMTRPNGRALAVIMVDGFKGFKISYSSFCFAHFIQRYQVISAYDKAFGTQDGKKDLTVKLVPAESTQEAFEIVYRYFNVPYCKLFVSGNFGGNPFVECSADTKHLEITAPAGAITSIDVSDKGLVEIPTDKEGFYNVLPISESGARGMDTTVWHCDNMREAFDRSATAVHGPGEIKNSCERAIHIWTKLCNMRTGGKIDFTDEVKSEFKKIIGDNPNPTVGGSILPYEKDGCDAYHLYGSDRVQNDFFVSSYLLEAYRVFGERYYLEYAVSIMTYLVKNRIKNGCVSSTYSQFADYTTVCAPIINVIDLSNELKSLADERYRIFENTAKEMCDHLIRRGWDFPTEGDKSNETEPEMEDGSISCTALTLLYYCANVQYVDEYAKFAREVLSVHKAWSIYTPDVRQYRSSFRWWETIWEGDKHGPTINAGHAWTIWRAEALYYLAMLDRDEALMRECWNSYMTNYCKMTADGSIHACYEPDFIVSCYQSDNDWKPHHGYPEKPDTSLSNYVWTRSLPTWLKTAFFTTEQESKIACNAKLKDGEYQLGDNITTLFIGSWKGTLKLRCKSNLHIAFADKIADVKVGYNVYTSGSDMYITPDREQIELKF